MADSADDSRPWGFIAVIAGIVLAALVFVLFVRAGDSTDGQLPQVTGKGLAWARDDLRKAGYQDITAHDAWGRNRSGGEDQEWQVCYQRPGAGDQPRSVTVSLAVTPVTQECPSQAEGGDQGSRRDVGDEMPDVVGRTAYMVRQDFGERASLRFVDRTGSQGQAEDLEVTDDLGDWMVCTQSVPSGAEWTGQPVEMDVVAYGQPC